MLKNFKKIILFLVILLLSIYSKQTVFAQGTTVEQKLELIQNNQILGGAFTIDYEIKGTNLTGSSTLGTLNADIVYDSTKLRFINGTNWNTGLDSVNGYSVNIQSNDVEHNSNRWLRISLTAVNVSNSNPAGFNLTGSYFTVVRINFIILNADNPVTLTIKDITNQVGFFANSGNSPDNSIINNLALSPPLIISGQPLPVELSSFNFDVSERNVNLKWSTDFEHNNAGFDIERKSSSKNDGWVKIGRTDGHGNTSSLSRYAYSDTKIPAGKYNYRLKQIDVNGNYKYYDLNGIVEIDNPKKFDISQNYPNPFNPTTKIDYALPLDSKVNIVIYDMLGREIKSVVQEQQKAGYYTVQINATDFASGTYFYRMIANANGNNNIITKKLSVIK